MKASTKFGILCMALAFASALLPPTAKADTYNVFVLASDESTFFRGMDSQGTVVLSYDIANQSTCLDNEPGCFYTYTSGQLVSQANTVPPMVTDNGTACTPSLPAGAIVYHGICNNGYEAFMGKMTVTQDKPFLYTGPNFDMLSTASGEGAFLFMNSEGDIVWNDPGREFWYEAINTTSQVPEPASLTLLATGALAALGVARRRRYFEMSDCPS